MHVSTVAGVFWNVAIAFELCFCETWFPHCGGLQDCKNGTYKTIVRMEKAGLASIHAQINGQPLGLPATLHVLPAELHSLLLVTPPAIDITAGVHSLHIRLTDLGSLWALGSVGDSRSAW